MMALVTVLFLPDRDERIHRFVLRRDTTCPVLRWSTHGISLHGPTSVFPFGMARWTNRKAGATITVAPSDSTVQPIDALEMEFDRLGLTADDLVEAACG